MGNWLRYIGNAVIRLFTHENLSQLGAEASTLEKLGENKAIVFAKGVAQHVDPELARFLAEHPATAAAFHVLNDDEIAAEQAQRTGNSGGSSTPTSSSPASGDSATDSGTSASSAASGVPTTDQNPGAGETVTGEDAKA